MAVVDIATFIADLKDHAADHGFHVHDERHFVETYTMRQAWEVDLHPAHACGGPLDVHVSVDVDPRVMIGFEDAVIEAGEDREPPNDWFLSVVTSWTLPPLPNGPDLLVLATELSGIGGTALPLQVSAVDSFLAVTDAPQRSLTIMAQGQLSLADIYCGREQLAETLARAFDVSDYLLDRAHGWLSER